jgi:hypothetical protein
MTSTRLSPTHEFCTVVLFVDIEPSARLSQMDDNYGQYSMRVTFTLFQKVYNTQLLSYSEKLHNKANARSGSHFPLTLQLFAHDNERNLCRCSEFETCLGYDREYVPQHLLPLRQRP